MKQINYKYETKDGYKVVTILSRKTWAEPVALVYRPTHNLLSFPDGYEYIIALNYDTKTGTWSQGHYYRNLKHALQELSDETQNDGYITTIQDVKQGAFIKRLNVNGVCNRVYIRCEYDRTEKGYLMDAWDDSSYSRIVKKNTIVLAGFTY